MPSRSLLGMRMEAPYGAGYKRPRKAAPAQQSAMTRVARQGRSRVIPQTPPSVGQAMTRAQSQFANMAGTNPIAALNRQAHAGARQQSAVNRVATEMQNQTGMAQPMGMPIKGRRYAK